MIHKIIRQAGIAAIIALSVMLLQSLHIQSIDTALNAMSAQLSKDYSMKDIEAFATQTMKDTKGLPENIGRIARAAVAPVEYGEPIDQIVEGKVSAVYAVSGGTVVEIGENATEGQFVKINHGNQKESTYGNCSKVYVKQLERVKKGQIIAEFDNQGDEEFYYTLLYLD